MDPHAPNYPTNIPAGCLSNPRFNGSIFLTFHFVHKNHYICIISCNVEKVFSSNFGRPFWVKFRQTPSGGPDPPQPTLSMEVQEKWQQRSMNVSMEVQEKRSVARTFLPHPTPPTPLIRTVSHSTFQKCAKRGFGFQPVGTNMNTQTSYPPGHGFTNSPRHRSRSGPSGARWSCSRACLDICFHDSRRDALKWCWGVSSSAWAAASWCSLNWCQFKVLDVRRAPLALGSQRVSQPPLSERRRTQSLNKELNMSPPPYRSASCNVLGKVSRLDSPCDEAALAICSSSDWFGRPAKGEGSSVVLAPSRIKSFSVFKVWRTSSQESSSGAGSWASPSWSRMSSGVGPSESIPVKVPSEQLVR